METHTYTHANNEINKDNNNNNNNNNDNNNDDSMIVVFNAYTYVHHNE